MKQTINQNEFMHAFHAHNRYEQFGYHALKAIFEHIEEYEEQTGEEQELDVIAICCEFTTFNTALEAATEYGFESELEDDADDKEKEALNWLYGETTVLEYAGGVVIQQF